MTKLMGRLRAHRRDILVYVVMFLMIIVLCRANIAGTIRPFGFAASFALIMLGKSSLFVSIAYFVGAFLFDISASGAISAGVAALMMLSLGLIFSLLKRTPNFAVTFLFAILSQAGYAYFHISSAQEVLVTIAMISVGLMFIYVSHQIIGVILRRGLYSPLTADESICLALFLIALFSGLYDIYIFEANLSAAIIIFCILLSSRIFSKMGTVYLSIAAGLGMAFASLGISHIAIYATFGTLAAAVRNKNKFFAPILVILADVVFGLFLNAYAEYSYLALIMSVAASVVYLCLPSKLLEKIKGHMPYEGSLANEYIVYGQRENVKLKLENTSSLMLQMQNAYRSLSIGEIDRGAAAAALAKQVCSHICMRCQRRYQCEENPRIQKAIEQLFVFGFEKKKVTIIDATNLLTTTCVGLNGLIEEVNQQLVGYFEFEKGVKNEDCGKMLVADQLGGVAGLLKEIANFSVGGQKIDAKTSEKIKSELILNGVVVQEVVVLYGDDGVEQVLLIVRNSDALSPILRESLKAVLHLDFCVRLREMTRLAGWSVILFVPAPKYKVQIGFAAKSVNPSAPSGDTYSFLKLATDKNLFAISDGMGHGARANKFSTAVLSLIESFYSSGFSSETIVTSVDNLLVPSAGEDFACLDACIVDTTSATADFVKVGASVSVIKSENTVRVVEGSSLPLGMACGARASIQKVVLKEQDIIVLASDGVVDSFDNPEQFASYVNNERVINVQMLADTILEEAQSRTDGHDDDKTVIAIKLVPSV